MEGLDLPEDDRTFKVSFTSDGLSALRERVMDKLKEYMGDYTDDTLVEYVVVLLRNGRCKDEARKELNVFLGDDSAIFVSWLWDHLSSNIHLYIQQKKSSAHEAANSKPISNELPGSHNAQESLSIGVLADSDHGREKLQKISRNLCSRDPRQIPQENREVFPLRSVVSNILHAEKAHNANIALQSHTPRTQVQRKRSRDDEHPLIKRDSDSYPKIDAPRRLLQFAVRDAVKTVQQSKYREEPASKRLFSVVSTDSLLETRSHRRSGSRVPGALSVALKAVAEAAQDATKDRSYGSVFDRLGRDRCIEENDNQLADGTASELKDSKYGNHRNNSEPTHLNHYYGNQHNVDNDVSMIDKMTDESSDYAMVNNEDDTTDVNRHDLDASQGFSLINKGNKLAILHNSVAQEPEKTSGKISLLDQEQLSRKRKVFDLEPSIGPVGLVSKEIVNISFNATTSKPPQHQMSRDDAEVENPMTVENCKIGPGVQNAKLSEEKQVFPVQNKKEIGHTADQREFTQKQASAPGSHSAGRPLEDLDSRTLFVSNVHFAATKDTLSRHFNKFGDVLKVIIITDGSTGQPTGSAYVEFVKKESADMALSLNGTSFMSRILKVVRRSSYQLAPMLPWSRTARAPSFASRLGRMPYLRGVVPGTFRVGLPMKPGARSLQWKRESSTVQPNIGAKASVTSGSNVLSPTARSLTYTRPT